ncbi:hypothetical protein B296_00031624 [Ensete ventricosum]|uniref:Uncharacterized protein n=1 Tax=Ensete ventricosum TaxID=4639 RepID=A0A426Z8K5_ENSVE|nr:hypothetical protein B296_00031624 [Ensete ventricosum]
MWWELAGNSLGLRRRYREDRYEHAGRSLLEDRETRCRECRRLLDCGTVAPPALVGEPPVSGFFRICYKGLVFTQRRSIMDAGVSQGGGLGKWMQAKVEAEPL